MQTQAGSGADGRQAVQLLRGVQSGRGVHVRRVRLLAERGRAARNA